MCQIQISTGKRKSKRVDSDEDIPHQKQQVYDHSTSSDEDSRSSSNYGKEPAGGGHYTKKGKLRPKELKGIIIASINLYIYFFTGHKRQRSEDSNSDGHRSSSKRKAYSKGSDSSHDSN